MHAVRYTKGLILSLVLICSSGGISADDLAAQGRGGNGWQGNQHNNYRPGNHHGKHGGYSNYGRNGYGYSPYFNNNFNYNYYQRPYPYHLDYYRMRYQGSYEPYAGNLYGPPLVQQNVISPFVAPQAFSQPFLPSPYYPTPVRNYAGAYYW